MRNANMELVRTRGLLGTSAEACRVEIDVARCLLLHALVRGSAAAAYRPRPAPMDEIRHANFEQDGVDDRWSLACSHTPSASQQQRSLTAAEATGGLTVKMSSFSRSVLTACLPVLHRFHDAAAHVR